jgi:hypothetical protein
MKVRQRQVSATALRAESLRRVDRRADVSAETNLLFFCRFERAFSSSFVFF